MTDEELIAEARRGGAELLRRPGAPDRYYGGLLKELADRQRRRTTADIPQAAIRDAAVAIMEAQNANDGESENWEAEHLARAALQAAAPILAKAWGVAPI